MKMEVLAVQTQYGVLGSNKVKDWSNTLTPPAANAANATPSKLKAAEQQSVAAKQANGVTGTPNNNNNNNSINNNQNQKKSSKMFSKRSLPTKQMTTSSSYPYNTTHHTQYNSNSPYTTSTTKSSSHLFAIADTETASAVNELSLRLLDELRAAKSRHLTCTEVSLPCDLTPCVAAEILRVSEKEPCGIRGCTIYIEFEDEPNNSRRIASLKLDPETVSTFEIYLTLRQDHRGWTSLLPQFMKSLARTITISPEFTITKHKLYSPQQHSSYSYNSATVGQQSSAAVAITAPTS